MILVTGTAGFIGADVSTALFPRGNRVGIDNLNDCYDSPLKEASLGLIREHRTFPFERIDIVDPTAMCSRCERHSIESIVDHAIPILIPMLKSPFHDSADQVRCVRRLQSDHEGDPA